MTGSCNAGGVELYAFAVAHDELENPCSQRARFPWVGWDRTQSKALFKTGRTTPTHLEVQPQQIPDELPFLIWEPRKQKMHEVVKDASGARRPEDRCK